MAQLSFVEATVGKKTPEERISEFKIYFTCLQRLMDMETSIHREISIMMNEIGETLYDE